MRSSGVPCSGRRSAAGRCGAARGCSRQGRREFDGRIRCALGGGRQRRRCGRFESRRRLRRRALGQRGGGCDGGLLVASQVRRRMNLARGGHVPLVRLVARARGRVAAATGGAAPGLEQHTEDGTRRSRAFDRQALVGSARRSGHVALRRRFGCVSLGRGARRRCPLHGHARSSPARRHGRVPRRRSRSRRPIARASSESVRSARRPARAARAPRGGSARSSVNRPAAPTRDPHARCARRSARFSQPSSRKRPSVVGPSAYRLQSRARSTMAARVVRRVARG
jgi:hypothetical protein